MSILKRINEFKNVLDELSPEDRVEALRLLGYAPTIVEDRPVEPKSPEYPQFRLPLVEATVVYFPALNEAYQVAGIDGDILMEFLSILKRASRREVVVNGPLINAPALRDLLLGGYKFPVDRVEAMVGIITTAAKTAAAYEGLNQRLGPEFQVERVFKLFSYHRDTTEEHSVLAVDASDKMHVTMATGEEYGKLLSNLDRLFEPTHPFETAGPRRPSRPWYNATAHVIADSRTRNTLTYDGLGEFQALLDEVGPSKILLCPSTQTINPISTPASSAALGPDAFLEKVNANLAKEAHLRQRSHLVYRMVKAITGKTQDALARDLDIDLPTLRAIQNEPEDDINDFRSRLTAIQLLYGLSFSNNEDNAITVHFKNED